MRRFNKEFIGEVEVTSMAYNIQENSNMEGYFEINVKPLRDDLCLLEERGEGELEFSTA